MATLEKAASLDPENEVPHALLGKLYQDSGKQDKAITEFETAHRLMPTDREVTYRLYRIYSIKGDSVNGLGCRTTWKPCSPATMPRRMVRPKRWF